jgi:uncharacterized membrane protein
MGYFEQILGVFLILFGLLKITVGIFAFLPKEKVKDKIHSRFHEWLAYDTTVAGRLYKVVLFIFGIYTFMHGLHKFHWLPHVISQYIVTRLNLYMMNLVMGLILVVFYVLVVYSPLNIPQKQDHKNGYILKGILPGLVFITMIPILMIYHSFRDNGLKGGFVKDGLKISISSIIIVCMFTLIARFIIDVKKSQGEKGNIGVSDVTNIFMIPPNIF